MQSRSKPSRCGRHGRKRCSSEHGSKESSAEHTQDRAAAHEMIARVGIKAAVITVSDKAFSGQRADRGGPLVAEYLKKKGIEVLYQAVVPDEVIRIKEAICVALNKGTDLILTTGGTGFSERDVTPEATLEMIERSIPGIPEYIRVKSSEKNKNAILSRAVCGIIAKSIVLNLPGKPEAAVECLDLVIEPLAHGIEILKGEVTEHG